MSDPYAYPKLRWPIELRLEKIDNQELLVVNCPVGISPAPLVLVGAVAPIVAAFDGTSSFEALTARFGIYGVRPEIITELVTLLDNGLYLATPKFFTAQEEIKDNFISSPIRPAALAGRSYAKEFSALASEIDGYLGAGPLIVAPSERRMVGLVSPHIDYRRGGSCYGKTYNYLRGTNHDLYILIGTSHMYSDRLFHLTKKDFENPLGMLKCDAGFVEKLATLHGERRSFEDEFLHKREHSLELQIPFLSRLHSSPRIVPILVGSFHKMLAASKLPSEVEEYESFVGSLAECMRHALNEGLSICVVAGVDMAHVGRQFGDNDSLTQARMDLIRERDEKYLDSISRHDKIALFSHIAEDGDARRVCGFPTMYTVLDLFDRLGIRYRAELYDYQQAVDFNAECAVTFAGMGLYGVH